MSNIIDKKIIKEVIKELEAESRKNQQNTIFHNTRLLLKHYNDLNNHVENAIDEISQIDIDMDVDGLSIDDIYILSIKRSKSKTMIMLAHIDAAIELLRQKQAKAGTLEKFDVLKKFYIDGVDYDDIVAEYNCGTNTPRRWMKEMIKELSILLFGLDGLKLHMV